MAAGSVQKNATHPARSPGRPGSHPRPAATWPRTICTASRPGFPYTVNVPVAHPRVCPARLAGSSIPPLPVHPRPTPVARPGLGDVPQGRVLAEPADHGHVRGPHRPERRPWEDAPSATTQIGWPSPPSQARAQVTNSTARASLVRNAGRRFAGMLPRSSAGRTAGRGVGGRSYPRPGGRRGPRGRPTRARTRTARRPARGSGCGEPRRPGRVTRAAGRGCRPVRGPAAGRRRPGRDDVHGQAGGDPIGPNPGGRSPWGCSTGGTRPRDRPPDPARHRPPAASEDGPDEEPGHPWAGSGSSAAPRAGKPVARG